MAHRIVGFLERPELDDRWEETVAPAWPEFLSIDVDADRGRVTEPNYWMRHRLATRA